MKSVGCQGDPATVEIVDQTGTYTATLAPGSACFVIPA